MRNLNSYVKDSFCQQVDDWMPLKVAEKIIRRTVFEQKKKKRRLSATRLSNNCACKTSIAPVKQKVLFTRPTLSVQCLLKLQALIMNHTISL